MSFVDARGGGGGGAKILLMCFTQIMTAGGIRLFSISTDPFI